MHNGKKETKTVVKRQCDCQQVVAIIARYPFKTNLNTPAHDRLKHLINWIWKSLFPLSSLFDLVGHIIVVC